MGAVEVACYKNVAQDFFYIAHIALIEVLQLFIAHFVRERV